MPYPPPSPAPPTPPHDPHDETKTMSRLSMYASKLLQFRRSSQAPLSPTSPARSERRSVGAKRDSKRDSASSTLSTYTSSAESFFHQIARGFPADDVTAVVRSAEAHENDVMTHVDFVDSWHRLVSGWIELINDAYSGIIPAAQMPMAENVLENIKTYHDLLDRLVTQHDYVGSTLAMARQMLVYFLTRAHHERISALQWIEVYGDNQSFELFLRDINRVSEKVPLLADQVTSLIDSHRDARSLLDEMRRKIEAIAESLADLITPEGLGTAL